MALKTILITGASRGIGRATALALAAPGVTMTLAARSVFLLEEVAAEARAAGASTVVAPCDVTIEDDVRRLVDQTTAATGRIDLLVHSVGGAYIAPVTQISQAHWEEQVRVHLTSLFLICKHATPFMHNGGLLVYVASVAARQVFPNWSAYCAAKHGALGLLGAVREELRPYGVRVTAVLPAATDTGLWDDLPGNWNRAAMLQPADVAAAIASLAEYPPHVVVEELTVGHIAGRL
ncbi:MAG: SDR family NAD(P)-dependent oxidoreductase [Roseiflexus sp.]|nr:SDR family NAD(P)-dependent oxidoreductase [Roseiflexus sp.]MCS7287860.1 SDR family NAD(P)-dependent oxidoreductase [Roseiflexus sp.]MDW8232527.1 SDR family NAD(P)-dependent oxidoreductase [Roseiflexaceae bacterium]